VSISVAFPNGPNMPNITAKIATIRLKQLSPGNEIKVQLQVVMHITEQQMKCITGKYIRQQSSSKYPVHT